MPTISKNLNPLLIVLTFLVSTIASALSPASLELLNVASDSSVSFVEIRPAFVKVAAHETALGNPKTTKDVVTELQALLPDYATRLSLDEDYWKLSYLLDQGWDITKPDSEGRNLLTVVLSVNHLPNINLVLRYGGWKIIVDESNADLLAKAGQKDNAYLSKILLQWESPAERKKLLEGDIQNLTLEGTPRRKSIPGAPAGEPQVGAAPAAPGMMRRQRGEAEYADVYIPYATNRSLTPSKRPINYNTPDGAEEYFSYENTGRLSYGVAKVTIPRIHEPGQIEKKGLFEFTWNPAKHVVLEKLILKNEQEFFADIGSRIKEREQLFASDPKLKENAKDVFVYIHGFNVGYDYAMKKTAQLIYDMDYPGVGIAFSWPARPVTIPIPGDFQADAERARQSVGLLQQFFAKLQEKYPERKVHIIAHSLGTRVLAQALTSMANAATPEQMDKYKKFFGHIILAAPAMDARVFSGQYAAQLSKMCNKVSIIASDDDMALKVESLAEDDSFSFPLGLVSEHKAALGLDMFNFDASALSEGTMSLDHSVYSVVSVAIHHMEMLLKKNPSKEEEVSDTDELGYKYMFKSEREDYFSTQRRSFWKFLPF